LKAVNFLLAVNYEIVGPKVFFGIFFGGGVLGFLALKPFFMAQKIKKA
jgi:hypothetical protein